MNDDREHHLVHRATQLSDRYHGVFAPETIGRLLHESYDLLAATSRMTTLLPCWPSASPPTSFAPRPDHWSHRVRSA